MNIIVSEIFLYTLFPVALINAKPGVIIVFFIAMLFFSFILMLAFRFLKHNRTKIAEHIADSPLKNRLDAVMADRKPFREPDFDLVALAAMAHSNRTYVSRCINQECGMSFKDYVNGYRLQDALELISNPLTRKTPHEACELAGFSSYASFVARCRMEYGKDPEQWAELHPAKAKVISVIRQLAE